MTEPNLHGGDIAWYGSCRVRINAVGDARKIAGPHYTFSCLDHTHEHQTGYGSFTSHQLFRLKYSYEDNKKEGEN